VLKLDQYLQLFSAGEFQRKMTWADGWFVFQANIPIRLHVKPLFVAAVLALVPTAFCVWLVKTQPVSTWLIALTAFSIELIVKVSR